MAVDERSRHQLHGRLDEVLGAEEAAILMSHLPPVGWADVATKHDLDRLESSLRQELGSEIGSVRLEIGSVRLEIESWADKLRAEFYKNQTAQTRTLVIAMMAATFTTITAVAGIVFGAAQLI